MVRNPPLFISPIIPFPIFTAPESDKKEVVISLPSSPTQY